MKATLDKGAIKVAYAAATSSDETARPVLEYVRIGNGEIIASDGFIMARRAIPTEPENSVMLIKANIILKAHKNLGGNELIIKSEDDEFALIENENEDSPTIGTRLLQAEYPNYEQILPTTDRKAYVALRADLLTKTLKIADKEGGAIVKIKVREPSQPVEIHIGKTKIYVMPVGMPEEE